MFLDRTVSVDLAAFWETSLALLVAFVGFQVVRIVVERLHWTLDRLGFACRDSLTNINLRKG